VIIDLTQDSFMALSDVSTALVTEVHADATTASRKRFQGVADLDVLLLVLDEEGNIRQLTPALRRALEYDADDPIQPSFFSHVHPKNLYRVMRDTAEMVACGKHGASWLLRLKTGRNRWRWFSATVRNKLSEPAASIVIVLRDPCG
jgi:PAS domain-containing protein